MNLLKGIKTEYSKVQWPKKTEVQHATAWVVVMSLVLCVYLGVFDLLLAQAIKLVTSVIGGYIGG